MSLLPRSQARTSHLYLSIDNLAASAILESLLTSQTLLPGVARSAASTLIRQLTEGDIAAESASESRSLLSQLHQRHPDAVQSASRAIIDEDDGRREGVEQLISSISLVSVLRLTRQRMLTRMSARARALYE